MSRPSELDIQLPETVPVVNIARARQLKGWMADLELGWLAVQALRHQTIVELGSYAGKTTRCLCDNTGPLSQVYAIDLWQHIAGAGEEFSEAAMEGTLRDFLNEMRHEVNIGRLIPLRMDHVAASQALLVRPDMVFVDGDHSYEGCRDAIKAWKPKIARGGLICGHDYNDEKFPGVIKAVKELLPEARHLKPTTLWAAEVE